MRSFIFSALSLFSSVLASGSFESSWGSGHSFDSRHSHIARQIDVVAGANVTNATEVEMVASAWYTGWHATDFPLSNVSWYKYTHLTYAFGITVDDPSTISLNDSDVELLPQFVSQAHENDVTASLSIGGWTGSRFYSTNVGSAENRTLFVKAVTDLADKYSLDGIDFDWEYPANQGIGCNAISTNDTANFLAFLQELRSTSTGSKLILTAATAIKPFFNTTGSPSSDVSAFAKVLDYVEVMNYDIWGSWSTAVGPNSPLNDTCAPPADQQGSAVSAVAAWHAAGMPFAQIALGVASYGHSFAVNTTFALANGSTTELAAYPSFNSSAFPVGDAWDDAPSVDVCGVFENQGGLWDFWGLIDAGLLNSNGSVAAGVPSRFDECSKTNYVYNTTTQVMISYDDAGAFAAKGAFIKDTGLRGFAMWEAGGDSSDILLDAILEASGFDIDDCE
ncbi:hypothetical protein EW145_g4627 [Phellinidium pouzarii]|uniref:GH18 domain-containing protein n=1 Tax=Phellinidium pouzarii TaxID=167371 RepID=A0A4V3XCF7_9AGAM|nr:hypothetical protein EW145_g4627 [Phellinidium pouzarii]